jgi:two-component system response regulator YesN
MIDAGFDRDLSVGEIADRLGVTPDYLRRVFVDHQGEPPVRYLIRRRLEAACDLLRLNQETFREIARRVGITNPYYFSRLFRQRFGVTPTQYRKRFLASPGPDRD